ncbi:MAG: hypothetical protein ACE5E8_05200 [Acidimicrobiia bacterium]
MARSGDVIDLGGDAGPEAAAAVAAVIRQVLTEERIAAAEPPSRPMLSPWVRSGLGFSPVFQDPWLPEPRRVASPDEEQ